MRSVQKKDHYLDYIGAEFVGAEFVRGRVCQGPSLLEAEMSRNRTGEHKCLVLFVWFDFVCPINNLKL